MRWLLDEPRVDATFRVIERERWLNADEVQGVARQLTIVAPLLSQLRPQHCGT